MRDGPRSGVALRVQQVPHAGGIIRRVVRVLIHELLLFYVCFSFQRKIKREKLAIPRCRMRHRECWSQDVAQLFCGAVYVHLYDTLCRLTASSGTSRIRSDFRWVVYFWIPFSSDTSMKFVEHRNLKYLTRYWYMGVPVYPSCRAPELH